PISVSANGIAGLELVTVSADGFVGDMATVVVGNPTGGGVACKNATADASHAARTYIKALDAVDRLCVKIHPECATALSQADGALDILVQAHGVVMTECH